MMATMIAKTKMPVPAMQQEQQKQCTTHRPSALLVCETPSLNCAAFGSLIGWLVGIVRMATKEAESAAGPQLSPSSTRLQQQKELRITMTPTNKPPHSSRLESVTQLGGAAGGDGGGGDGG